MIIETLPVGPLQSNCYILGCEMSRLGWVIDPGDEAHKIVALLDKLRLTLDSIFCTHAHLDHVAGLADLKRSRPAPVWMHEEDRPLFQNLAQQAAWIGLDAPEQVEVEKWLNGGETVTLGEISGQVLHTPGHSPGSCSLLIGGHSPVLFSGDTLFRESIGRTDLWGGSYETLINSMVQKILPLPGILRIYPGHGPSTTLNHEKEYNPFIQEMTI